MANVQTQFDTFHSDKKTGIRLGRFKKEKQLRDKRNVIRRRLKANLPGVFAKYGEPNLVPKFKDQGSYKMNTGIKPLAGGSGYDIDQGVYFETPKDGEGAYSPLTLKKRVEEALNGLTDTIRIRRPCVTVFYKENGVEEAYHVDLAIYSARGSNSDGKDYLAVGRVGDSLSEQEWKVSDPAGLQHELFRRFEDDTHGRQQFRRIMRFMKRWKDVNFSSAGNGAPRGIGLTLNAHYGFTPTYSDWLNRTRDDLGALRKLVDDMLSRFSHQYREKRQEWGRCLIAKLPVEPVSDVYENMTLVQMTSFETKLKDLKAALDAAHEESDPHEACKGLQKVFGSDFPVPAKSDTARKAAAGAASSGLSG
ncbi:hypothetical protein LGH70_22245 [Hymenobacter sp. BT635]|uniref:Cyclic GMP-AMP synthase n=1 Tax=Hymenobacter nitidus TaxID=2880929 RepID=A0ABS8ALF7_9BACT|nr:hypothetical protein [Hymenobacter nitidus]MCB2380329.1 hypothetical protein [Hymenobacter nitidus]